MVPVDEVEEGKDENYSDRRGQEFGLGRRKVPEADWESELRVDQVEMI